MTTDALIAITQTLQRLQAQIERLTDWRLVGLHDAVRLTGSIVLGLAMERQALDEAEQQRRYDVTRGELAATQRYFELLN